MKHIGLLLIIVLLITPGVPAQVRVVASTTDLADFASVLGGDAVLVDHIVRGSQNPHFIEVKPSYMLKLKSADIFLIVGLELELWAPQIIDGSRNPDLLVVDCSRNIERLEVPTARVDKSMGDLHPNGNPHYWLDPENVRTILQTIYEAFIRVDPEHAALFQSNMEEYLKVIEAKTKEWTDKLKPLNKKSLVTYHSSFPYFTRRFGLQVLGFVEPKPGIPPTPSHTVNLMRLMRKSGVTVIGLEQFYDESVPEQIGEAVGARVVRLTTSVEGLEGTESYIDMMNHNVNALAEALAKD